MQPCKFPWELQNKYCEEGRIMQISSKFILPASQGLTLCIHCTTLPLKFRNWRHATKVKRFSGLNCLDDSIPNGLCIPLSKRCYYLFETICASSLDSALSPGQRWVQLISIGTVGWSDIALLATIFENIAAGQVFCLYLSRSGNFTFAEILSLNPSGALVCLDSIGGKFWP